MSDSATVKALMSQEYERIQRTIAAVQREVDRLYARRHVLTTDEEDRLFRAHNTLVQLHAQQARLLGLR